MKRRNNLRFPKIHHPSPNGTLNKQVLNRVERPLLRTILLLLVLPLLGVAVSTGCQVEAPVGDPQNVTARLVILLQDPSRDVRRTAALSLGKIAHPAATAALVEALSDPDPHVREYSAWAMGQLGEDVPDEAAVSLAEALGDQRHAVKRAAAQALGKIGLRQPVMAVLTQVLAAGQRGSRRAAVEALAQLDADGAYPALRNALTDPDSTVRQGALAALGELGDRRVLADFRERLLFDPDPGVRTEAAYRLGKLGTPGDHAELQALDEAARNDASPMVRLWAERARAYIGPAMTEEDEA